MRTVMFIFGGRQENLGLALPYYNRLLDENPELEIHLWDLARDPADHGFMQSLPTTDRFQVRSEFYDRTGRATSGQNKVWDHYCDPMYADCLLVKGDDDLVFWETERFGAFLDAVEANPDAVVSARIINNGACTFLQPTLQAGFEKLDIPLLDVHRSLDYADLCHRWFFQYWENAIDREPRLVAPQSWLSINLIGFHPGMCRRISEVIGTRSPEQIADRHYPRRNERGRILRHRVGDEGSVNLLPRLIFDGFCVAHLTFGPQERQMTAEDLLEYRTGYARILHAYLGGRRRTIRSFGSGFIESAQDHLEPA